MADVGDRVAVTSKAAARSGVVTGVSGSLLRVLWDTGEETSFVPGVGALSVIAGAETKPPNTKRTPKIDAATKTATTAKPSEDTKKSSGRPTVSTKTAGKKNR